MAPPNSYIYAEDFATPRALVEYLEYLDSNDTAYMEYHQWRSAEPEWNTQFLYEQHDNVSMDDQLMGASITQRMYCDICKSVKERKDLGFPKKIIKSVCTVLTQKVTVINFV